MSHAQAIGIDASLIERREELTKAKFEAQVQLLRIDREILDIDNQLWTNRRREMQAVVGKDNQS
ncbi:MAG: hypothetical protein AAFY81_08435 [Pseudomonadota bacterium]